MTSIPISIRRTFEWVALAAVAGTSLLVIFATVRPSEPRASTERPAPKDPRRIEGGVLWADGQPARGARVSMVALHPDQGLSETVADEAGRFRFVGVPNWTYSITARMLDSRDPLRVTAIGHLESVAVSTPRVEVALARLLPIRGTVVDATNRPVSGVHVQITGSSALVPLLPRDGLETQEDGRFEVWAPEGARASLGAVRQSWFGDMGVELGPTVLLNGVEPGAEGIVLRMPDER